MFQTKNPLPLRTRTGVVKFLEAHPHAKR